MATIVFGGGEQLVVTEPTGDVLLQLVQAAAGRPLMVETDDKLISAEGFAVFTPEHGPQVFVRPAQVAYVSP